MTNPQVPISSPPTGPTPWRGEAVLVRAWCLWIGFAVIVPLLVDVFTGGFTAAGRFFLGSMLVFHLIVVPGLRSTAGPGVKAVECLLVGVLVLPPAEVVRGMTGAPLETLLPVSAVVAAAHLVGSVLERLGRGHIAWLQYGYWPLVVTLGAAWPLAAYVGGEFLGCPDWPWPGGMLRPFVILLDG